MEHAVFIIEPDQGNYSYVIAGNKFRYRAERMELFVFRWMIHFTDTANRATRT